MELMSIRNPNSTLLYRAHSRPPVKLCAPPRSLLPSRRHFSAPRAVVSYPGIRFGFTSPEVLLNRSVVAFAASHEDSVSSVVVLKTSNFSVGYLEIQMLYLVNCLRLEKNWTLVKFI